MTFPVNGPEREWHLTRELANELAGLFPGLEHAAEFRSALANVLAGNRKTARGMRRFLTDWLQRSTNNPRLRAKTGDAAPTRYGAAPSRQDRRAAEIAEVLK